MAGRAWIGTSGWSYQHWRQVFYPPGVPARDWLAYYSRFLPSVEINASFYRLPAQATFTHWRAVTPPTFRFAAKVSRLITHYRRLRGVEAAWETFLGHAAGLGEKLACVLVQLPPGMEVDAARLEGFLRLVPAGLRAACEFRHPSWFTPQVYRVLSRYNCALCQANVPGQRGVEAHTADFAYLRMHGGPSVEESDYSPRELDAYAHTLAAELAAGRDVYVYFNNDVRGYAVANARYLHAQLAPGGQE